MKLLRCFLTFRTLRQFCYSAKRKRSLTIENLNPNIKLMEYAVRGPLVTRAGVIEKELEQGASKPFKEVLKANVGDCHAMGQVPITFIRQVLALTCYPPLFNDQSIPDDAKERAATILEGCRGGSIGSYTDSPGIEAIRKHVAEYIEKRDGGVPCDFENIMLCTGASDGIKNILKLLICAVGGQKAGVLTPIPQYPLYSASLAEFDLTQVGYYLDESKNWGLDVSELKRAVLEGRKTCNPRAIVVINPGNPTGQVLSKKNIEEIIKFAHEENLFILADEVYQDNVYASGSKFHSFKKILTQMGKPYNDLELASFMSASKGYMGECGLRGGYTEILNMDPEVKLMYLKCISAMLCPSALGQACMDTVVNPPREGEPSYEKYITEKTAILDTLKFRAEMVVEAFNAIEGFSCNPVQGSMYAFPQFRLSQSAIEAAKKAKQAPDVFYAFQLLERTGICIIAGSGFGQQPGTYHFRTTILPPTEKLQDMLKKFQSFHTEFVNKYK